MLVSDRGRYPHLRLAFIAMATVLAGLLGVPSAFAGRTDVVDPALMQPALNPAFGPWTCWRAGEQIVCDGSRTLAYSGLVVDFLSCPVGPIYSRGTITSTARRVGDAAGRAVETSFRDRYTEYFSTDPGGAEPRLRSVGRLQHSFSYAVPGDPSTVSETLAGMALSVTGAGFGVVIHDVGTVAWDSNGELIRIGGVHPPAFSPEEWQETHDRICSVFESGS